MSIRTEEWAEPEMNPSYNLAEEATRLTLQAGDRKVTVPLSPQIVEDGILEGRWSREDKREALRIVEDHGAE